MYLLFLLEKHPETFSLEFLSIGENNSRQKFAPTFQKDIL